MLATLVIGLREGLEAALIVGMIAAFLRRNGASLKPMWLGVAAAVLLSALVGVTLELVSAALPQQQQEAMETVIGAVAVVIVTFMILWMSKNSRSMKSTLEAHAGSALAGGSVIALAGMAFLAVLREGVETAVFLTAAFQSSLNPVAAGTGAVAGLLVASLAGVLLAHGAIKFNLARFFKATGVFLVFVAAGLAMKSLRTAHEAGWINTGQDRTLDLSWLAPNGSARAALLTGVFGIPSDPRVVEVLGWALYLIPMLAFVLWPRTWRPSAAALPRVQFAAAGALAAAAAVLVFAAPLAIPAASVALGTTPAVTSAGSPAATLSLAPDAPAAAAAAAGAAGTGAAGAAAPSGAGASLDTATLVVAGADGSVNRIALTGAGTESHAGRTAAVYTAAYPADASAGGATTDPASLTAVELLELNSGRMPVGVGGSANPGPFAAAWKHKQALTVWLAGGVVVDAELTDTAALTLSGGGLETPRTIALSGDGGWHVPEDHVTAAVAELATMESARADNVLFSRMLPSVLGLAAAGLVFVAIRNRRQLLATAPSP